MTNSISRLFLDTPLSPLSSETFRTSTQINDFWAFAQNVMPRALHWEYWYGVQDPTFLLMKDDKAIFYENRILGRPRLRQLRVHHIDCPISEKFVRLIRINCCCYPSYSKSHEKTGHYHPFLGQTLTAWRHHTAEELEGVDHWGLVSTYSGGGAYQLLGKEKSETIQIVENLKREKWISRATRAIFLDFSVYNTNANLFCVVTLIWEFPATGGVIPSWKIRTILLDRYNTIFDYFRLGLEIIFIIFTIYYTIQEVIEMVLAKCSVYWREFWTYLDIAILLLSYACIGFGFYRYYLTENTLPETLKEFDKFINVYWLGFWETQFNNSIAVLVFLIWIKVFKYISFNKTMGQLSLTMSRSAKDVFGFAVMFFIVFFAFVQLGYLLFGSTVEDFRTFHDTIYALLRLILGDFNFRAIEEANRIMGPIFFITYVFFVFFVLLNMFLAIINDTYSEVKAEVKAHGDEFQVSDYVKRGFNNTMGTFGWGSKKIEAEGKAKLASSENVITQQELRDNLQQANYTDMEIEMFLARYELDGHRAMDIDEAENVLGGLEGHHSVGGTGEPPAGGDASGGATNVDLMDAEIGELQSRIGVLESSLTNVTRKMDSLLTKLDKLDPAGGSHRSVLSKKSEPYQH